ncbi:MAG: hypothetical protein E7577_05335 [Ruminococcaceae bacterium]|nr:hypothetical protein [Oscillospiraceae bacterium]
MVQFDEKVYGPAKEKIESIFDTGTFVELCAYTKRLDSQKNFEGVVCGYGSVNGKLAFAFVQDSGRTKGAFGERHAKKIADTYALAIKNGAPIIGVFDSAGAVVYDGASALAAYGKLIKCVSDASGVVPQIAVIDGVCGGMSAVAASMFDITVAIKDSSKFYVNAPFIVGSEKGTADFAAAKGMAAKLADDSASAYAFVRELVTVLPQNNADVCMVETADSLNRESSFDPEKYTAEEIVSAVADSGSFLGLYGEYTSNATLGIASFGGVVSGVVLANGALDIRSARAISKLVSFCDSFAIPVVTLVDSCGLDVSGEAEDNAYASELAKLAYAYSSSENAKVTVIVGKAYGAAFTLLGSKSEGADMVYALPNAAVSVLSPEASVAFVWNDKVGKQSREELEVEWKEKCASAADAADRGEIDDIVEPAELRKRICAALMMLVAKAEGKPTRRHANMPL